MTGKAQRLMFLLYSYAQYKDKHKKIKSDLLKPAQE